MRAGGKHNDLENVGYTARHHTFFEMLGNFSFGDYFKEDAIKYAWELVTEKFGLPKEKLLVTVYHTDDEAYNVWHNIVGVPADRIIRIGDKYPEQPYNSDNFWQMGDTGPCGPCTEIFYDHGEHIWGGVPGSAEEDGDRFIEIWNLVFMQYERQADGELVPLPKPSVDTGMGLERIAAILQGVHSNYEIDMFVALIAAAAKATNTTDLEHNSLKVIADHIRSVAFLLVDGVVPSNEGRGYVLRRIIRRAGEAYPDLREYQSRIEDQIKREEERFGRTIDSGMNVLEADLSELTGDTISGETLFKLYDTYGFPVDLTADIARERNLNVDLEGYEKAMQRQVEKSQASGSFKSGTVLKTSAETEFVGYSDIVCDATVVELFEGEKSVQSIDANSQNVTVIVDKTPCYGESGGQVGDIGAMFNDSVDFTIDDTQKQANAHLHTGSVGKGILSVGDSVTIEVDAERRQDIRKNHSATHLLHCALHQVLGKQATQKGSLVNDERLRFDFSHDQAVSDEQLAEIEDIANYYVLQNYEVKTALMTPEEAKERGAMALFGEKYGDVVRVVTIGEDSVELCGGTHVKRSGDIGQIIITAESGVAAGVRRIEAVTGWGAIQYNREKNAQLQNLLAQLKATPDNAEHKIIQLFEAQKDLQKQIKTLKQQLLSGSNTDFNVREVNGFKVLTGQVEGYSVNELRDLADQQRDKQSAVKSSVKSHKLSAAKVAVAQTSPKLAELMLIKLPMRWRVLMDCWGKITL